MENNISPCAEIFDSPGQLLANLPGFLGFYPQDSIVLVAVVPNAGDPALNCLGPLIRINISHSNQLAEVLGIFNGITTIAIFGFVISEHPAAANSEFVYSIMKQAGLTVGGNEKQIDAWWYTSAIFEGEPYHLYPGISSSRVAAAVSRQVHWQRGHIPSIASALATQTLLNAGFCRK